MTNNEIRALYGFLSRIKVTKVADKTTRGQIIAAHLALHKVAAAIDSDIREIQKMFSSGREAEFAEYFSALKEKLPANPEIAKLNGELNEAVGVKLAETNDAEFPKINEDGLVEALAAQDIDITCGDLLFLSPILE